MNMTGMKPRLDAGYGGDYFPALIKWRLSYLGDLAAFINVPCVMTDTRGQIII